MSRYIALFLAFAMSVAAASAAVADTASLAAVAPVNRRIARHQDAMWRITPQSFANPALKQWMLPVSYSSLSGRYADTSGSQPVDSRLGSGEHYFGIEARSYIKHRSSTLWGTAAYHNGVRESVVWNESSDAPIIYPYFTADSISGDLKGETYSFSGGYADHTDRWSWGVTLSYNAGQYYRNVDPRPRNVTGRLDIAAGAAYRIGASSYQLGASLNFRKYKQSCDIEFVNELADTRIWHLTGLGTHYQRFAGSGYSHYYNGHRWGGSLDLYPSSRRGAVASAAFSRFEFDHILTSLNKLPLASASENRLELSAGWLAPGKHHDWAAVVRATISKRTGTENIFGDASANVYPKIGSLTMYTHSLAGIVASGLWQWRPDAVTDLSLRPEVSFCRSRQSYADSHRHTLIASLSPSVSLALHHGFGRMWRAGLSASFSYTAVVDSDIVFPLSASDPQGMQSLEIRRFDILSRPSHNFSVGASLSRAVSGKYALQLSARFGRTAYAHNITSRNLDIALSFIF